MRNFIINLLFYKILFLKLKMAMGENTRFKRHKNEISSLFLLLNCAIVNLRTYLLFLNLTQKKKKKKNKNK